MMKTYTVEELQARGITEYGAYLMAMRVNEYNRQCGDITNCEFCNGRGNYMYVNGTCETLKECSCMKGRYAERKEM